MRGGCATTRAGERLPQPTRAASMSRKATLQPCRPKAGRRSSLFSGAWGWQTAAPDGRAAHGGENPICILAVQCIIAPCTRASHSAYRPQAPCSRPGRPVQRQPTWNPFTSFLSCRWLRGWPRARPGYNYYIPPTPIPRARRPHSLPLLPLPLLLLPPLRRAIAGPPV